jgi:hypothetical protein
MIMKQEGEEKYEEEAGGKEVNVFFRDHSSTL